MPALAASSSMATIATPPANASLSSLKRAQKS
jgi:hypothetical protein